LLRCLLLQKIVFTPFIFGSYATSICRNPGSYSLNFFAFSFFSGTLLIPSRTKVLQKALLIFSGSSGVMASVISPKDYQMSILNLIAISISNLLKE